MSEEDHCMLKRIDLEERIEAKMDAIRMEIEKDMHEVRQLIKVAFPKDEDGQADFIGHRKAHEVWIKKVEAETEFFNKMKMELVKWGLLGFAGWAIYQLWIAFLHGPAK